MVWPTEKVSVSNVAGSQRLIQRVDGIKIARRAAHQVERPVELNVRHGLFASVRWTCEIGCGGLVLQRVAAGAVEGAPLRDRC